MSALATYSRPAMPVRSAPAAPRATSITPATGSPYATPASRYRDAELASATPGQLVVLLYDKLVLTLRRARLACEGQRIEERCDLLMRAHEMIDELRLSLDHVQGGAIASQLEALYGFMQREVHAANRMQDPARIDVVVRMASELRDAFAGALAQTTAAAARPARSA